jgi:hypothetical protein
MLWFDAVGAAQGSRVWARDEAAVRALRQRADGRPPITESAQCSPNSIANINECLQDGHVVSIAVSLQSLGRISFTYS